MYPFGITTRKRIGVLIMVKLVLGQLVELNLEGIALLRLLLVNASVWLVVILVYCTIPFQSLHYILHKTQIAREKIESLFYTAVSS